jgi:glycosyltransferase involved in cell wall biosynthesis
MLFSIIIPVYKVEKYLSQCIESVINQSFADFEIILVDDGSPDNSGAICDEYAIKDNRITVIHKKNEGVSKARNSGLSVAKGIFIWFLDSDDFMATNAIEEIASTIMKNNNLDMITCAHINEYCNGNSQIALLPMQTTQKGISMEEFLAILYKTGGAYWAPWKNIYKRDVIVKNDLMFSSNIICAEDSDFFMNFVRVAEEFYIFNKPTVHYRIDREGSMTNTMSIGGIMGQLYVFSSNYNFYDECEGKNNDKMKTFFANKFANSISLLYNLRKQDDIEKATIFISANNKVLKNTSGLKYNIAKLVWFFYGYYNGSVLLQKIRRIIHPNRTRENKNETE